MESVSADGTVITWQSAGRGSPVVLVGGALEDRSVWDGVVALLRDRATTHAVDRRGRGASGDRPGSTPADEIADVRAVLAAVTAEHGPALLVGHSSGALLALHAAAGADGALRAVVAYEPAPAPPVPGVGERLDALVRAGDREQAVVRFLTDAVGVPVDAARARAVGPDARGAVALAHTLAHDARIAEAGLPADVAARIAVPVTLLLGTASAGPMIDHVDALRIRLPRATVWPLEGQTHFALRAAPGLVAPAVLAALDGVPR